MDDKDLFQIEIIKTKEREIKDAHIKYYEIVLPYKINSNSEYCGFDPGTRNFGIAVLRGDTGVIYQIAINTSRDPVYRLTYTINILKNINCVTKGSTVTIEGAAFRGGFSQQELAEMRATIALYSMKYAKLIMFAAPMSIRKLVFGHGRTKPQEVWKGLPNDALAALSCAYYGYKKENMDDTKKDR